ncbi:MAG: ATP-dependent zinc metalloprotease FtsH, partial [Gemmatimonadetes bacterium]|nr:ATP-dependent zinc metalloprotease FtsH [Gemmatimonadota bacterium]
DEAKVELQEIVEFLQTPERFQALGGKIPRGVLLVGSPGTGKTLLAKAVAGEAGVPFFSISGSDFVEMFVGVGAARVRDLFEQAKKHAPAIIFIDELDALGKARGVGGFGGHDEREQTLNQLLTELDGFATNAGIILMAATNRPEILDPALLRPGRFDRTVAVDRPDVKGREAILRIHAREAKLDTQVDLHRVAVRTPGFAGADLANVINEAALLAARRNKSTITMDELSEAVERAVGGLERKSRVLNEKERRIVAYHEAGHAIVGELLDEANPVEKISIIPRGIGALGYTLNTPAEDRYLMTKNELLDTTCALLGGRAAEEIVFSEISTGAANDLQRATSIAQSMVKEYGMSETLGLVAHREERNQNQFMGMGSPDRPFSEETSRSIDSEVALIISQSYERAKVVLTEKREEMEKVVTVLFETEIMEGDQLRAILGKEPRHEEDTLSGAAAPAAEEAVNDGTSNKDHGAPSETTSAKSDPDAPGESPTTNESDVEDGPQSDDSATN